MNDCTGNRLLALFPDATLALLKGHLSNLALPQDAVCFNPATLSSASIFPSRA